MKVSLAALLLLLLPLVVRAAPDAVEGGKLVQKYKCETCHQEKVYGPVGCDTCTGGYKGRVGIYQVMPVSEEMGRIIMEGGNSMELAKQAAAEGIADLRASGLRKVVSGITSLEEIDRVTKE